MNLVIGTANFGNNYGLTSGIIDSENAQNIINFAGKPIIFYSIEAALKSKLFDQIVNEAISVY